MIELDPSAVSAQDSQGKSPIHYLCLHYIDAFRPGHLAGNNAEDGMIQAVEAFLEANPSIVTIEDESDYTALEYAIESNAPYKVVRRLQKATERFWKDQQKMSVSVMNDHALQGTSQGARPMHHDRNIFEEHTLEHPATHLDSNEEKTDGQTTAATKPKPAPLPKKPSVRSKYAMTA